MPPLSPFRRPDTLAGGGLRALALLCLTLFGACAAGPETRTSVLDGRKVEHLIAGRGTPPVVFENGLGGRLDLWAKVIAGISAETTVFAYNRPGTGASTAVPGPRDGDRIVAELRRDLRDAGLRPPYVLVGHSLGGLYMQLYARRHPDEVAGLVLVDSTHPDQMSGPGARENWPLWVDVVIGATTSKAARRELDTIPATGAQMLALPPLRGKPVVVLSALEPMTATSALAQDANRKRAAIAGLHPGARQVWVESGHVVPLEAPQAVIDAIRAVLSEARRGAKR